MYYLTRSHRRADAVRKIYGCCEDIDVLESIARVSNNQDFLYEIWDNEGRLVKIAPKIFDYMHYADGGFVHAPEMVQIKGVHLRDEKWGHTVSVNRKFPVIWKEIGISRALMEIEIPAGEYKLLDRSDVISEFMRDEVYRQREERQKRESNYDNVIHPRMFYKPPLVADDHGFGREGRDNEPERR